MSPIYINLASIQHNLYHLIWLTFTLSLLLFFFTSCTSDSSNHRKITVKYYNEHRVFDEIDFRETSRGSKGEYLITQSMSIDDYVFTGKFQSDHKSFEKIWLKLDQIDLEPFLCTANQQDPKEGWRYRISTNVGLATQKNYLIPFGKGQGLRDLPRLWDWHQELLLLTGGPFSPYTPVKPVPKQH